MKGRMYYVYIMTNIGRAVLYTGVTSNLPRRVAQHKAREYKGFTCRYHVTVLVYYEVFFSIRDAIFREKQIKAGSRAKKLALVNENNPQWRDLALDL